MQRCMTVHFFSFQACMEFEFVKLNLEVRMHVNSVCSVPIY